MPLISIREHGGSADTAGGAVIAIDGQEFPIQVTDPFSKRQEVQLEWYFEQHLRFPFTNQVAATEAAASVAAYGEALFNQLFEDFPIGNKSLDSDLTT